MSSSVGGCAQRILEDLVNGHNEDMASRDNANYALNREQFDKFLRAYEYFVEVAAVKGGRVDPITIEPKQEKGCITAYFNVFFVYSDYLERLKEIVGDMSALCIDANLDGEVCISFNIPEIYKAK